MNAKELIEAIKNFFLDFIGFFLPGFMFVLLVSICISPTYFVSTPILKTEPSLYIFLTVVLSYILGYLIYGIGVIKDDILKRLKIESSTIRIEKETTQIKDFGLALTKYNAHIATHSLGVPLALPIQARELRTLVFSFLKNEEKNLVYTFMFRSDLCKHLYSICLILGLAGWISFGLRSLVFKKLDLFLTDRNSLILYGILILSVSLFRQTRNYFYRIAIKIPFSMYLSK